MEFLTVEKTTYSRRIKRGIVRALEASMEASDSEFKVGAVLTKNGNIIGSGHNHTRKTSPNSGSRHFGQHAEYSCLRKSSKLGEKKNSYDLVRLSGAELFVARITPGGRVALAKPCDSCQSFLRHLNLKRIYYTNENGGISDMTLRND